MATHSTQAREPSPTPYIVTHIFLPPQLPQECDYSSEGENHLLSHVNFCLSHFKRIHSKLEPHATLQAQQALVNLQRCRMSSGGVDRKELAIAFNRLYDKGEIVPVHIVAQNAGILFQKEEHSIIAEVFELSPTNEAVMSTQGRLRRTFPGSAVSIPIKTFSDRSFQTMLVETLAVMSEQTAAGTLAKVKKAGQMHDEERDTKHPRIVTELLQSWLLGVGSQVVAFPISKNTRDDVLWHSTLMPWRRSALWLMIRVVLHLIFARQSTVNNGGKTYKIFMLYMMAKLLESHLSQFLAPDLLFAMNAKITRRRLKLGGRCDSTIAKYLYSVCRKTIDHLNQVKSDYLQHSVSLSKVTPLAQLDCEDSTIHKIPLLTEYLMQASTQVSERSQTEFKPAKTLLSLLPSVLPTLENQIPRGSATNNVLEVEAWVASHLQSWLEGRTQRTETCSEIKTLMRAYDELANKTVKGNPEAISVQVLTTMELWIACDKAAVNQCKLLAEYDPAIPHDVFQSLLVPSADLMSRLHLIERYLADRRSQATYTADDIFRSFGTSSSFAVRYFATSETQRTLYDTIVQNATTKRTAKETEFKRKKEEYKTLMRQFEESECEYREVVPNPRTGVTEYRHITPCRHCRYKREAEEVTIEIHEWPLPKEAAKAQASIFELAVPAFFVAWRDATVFLKHDVLRMRYAQQKQARTFYPLSRYDGLSRYASGSARSARIFPVSENKPHGVTHRAQKQISNVTLEEICLDNGMNYAYFDNAQQVFVSQALPTSVLPKRLHYQLPQASGALQAFLFRPAAATDRLTPNETVARQAECPLHLSVDEFRGLASMLVGFRLGWLNILLQLNAPSIDWKTEECTLVVLQTIFQAGPPEFPSPLRHYGHLFIEGPILANRLLSSLTVMLSQQEDNWESSQMLGTFVSICLRVLTCLHMEYQVEVVENCLSCLAQIRRLALRWTMTLRDVAAETTNDEQLEAYRDRIIQLALIGIDTFNVEPPYRQALFAEDATASMFIQFCMIVHQDLKPDDTSTKLTIRLLLSRAKRLTIQAYPLVRDQIIAARSNCLDMAISSLWPAHQGQLEWSSVGDDTPAWLTAKTGGREQRASSKLHYNLINGELLIDGQRISRLPVVYEQHPTYHCLFGSKVHEALPSPLSRMAFSSKQKHKGFTVHFTMQKHLNDDSKDQDLIVHVEKEHHKFSLIPTWIVAGHFPIAFVEDFVHWYDEQQRCVRFVPRHKPWSLDDDGWRLDESTGKSGWRFTNANAALMSTCSPVASCLHALFASVADIRHIHLKWDQKLRITTIDMPRVELSFELEAGTEQIKSVQWKGMLLDPDQSLGTLHGLKDKLILRDAYGNQMLLISEGPVIYAKHHFSTHVSIQLEAATSVQCYSIDKQLGRLVDNGSVQSKLFLAYLHALTSFCLPDSLTSLTGTEQAITTLKSASLRSFEHLTAKNIDILLKLAALTPHRSYYPPNERVMQNVRWKSDLQPLVQHGDYVVQVRDIFAQNARSKLFYTDAPDTPQLQLPNIDLLRRDTIRSSTYRTWGFGAEHFTTDADVAYRARDRGLGSSQAKESFAIASLFNDSQAYMHDEIKSTANEVIWNLMGKNPLHTRSQKMQVTELVYDTRYLLDCSSTLAQNFLNFRFLSLTPDVDCHKFSIAIWLSTLAFAQKIDEQLLLYLIALFKLKITGQDRFPLTSIYECAKGFKFKGEGVKNALLSCQRTIEQCPEFKLQRTPNEKERVFKKRRKTIWQRAQQRMIDSLVEILRQQWPCAVPRLSSDTSSHPYSTYFNMTAAKVNIESCFHAWHQNLLLWNYLCELTVQIGAFPVDPISFPKLKSNGNIMKDLYSRGFVSENDIFDSLPSPRLKEAPTLDAASTSTTDGRPRTAPKRHLRHFVQCLDKSASLAFQKQYVSALSASEQALAVWHKSTTDSVSVSSVQILQQHRSECLMAVEAAYSTLEKAVNSPPMGGRVITHSRALVSVSQLAPRVCNRFFLQQLSHTRWELLSAGWKNALVRYGLLLAAFQRANRLVEKCDKPSDLRDEMQNLGHESWSPIEYPEALLMEIENNLTIRARQWQIVEKMLNPPLKQNSVMQLKMGDGKSSVIVPVVASTLADEKRLVRVITAKPQATQMSQMLISKVGGLLEHRVYYLPFSRTLRMDDRLAKTILEICRECVSNRGILLTQPAHIHSLRLMSVSLSNSEDCSTALPLLETQSLFSEQARDIVDESDENFNTKFELIYTIGQPHPVDLSPDRWLCIQEVLAVLQACAVTTHAKSSSSIEIACASPEQYPRMRFLDDIGERDALLSTVQVIVNNGIHGLPLARQSDQFKVAVRAYINELDVDPAVRAMVECESEGSLWLGPSRKILLLLRGLFAGRILAFCFRKKRWRVDYGLAWFNNKGTKECATRTNPTRLGIPYTAKDIPSLNTEFSHTEVIIVLTQLAYYYSGMNDEDLFLAFDKLSKSDSAASDYYRWVKDIPNLPLSLRSFSSINLQDRVRCVNELFPLLRYSCKLVDDYLALHVFPRELREFPSKLSASGWDLGERKSFPTTAFSGTVDSHWTLPLSMHYLQLPEQKHTDAMVIDFLLQKETGVTRLPPTAYEMLIDVTKMVPKVQVILDVGALVLELTNRQVAESWLSLADETARAIIYFDDNHNLIVLDRKKNIQYFQLSPFAHDTGGCLVFLDECHTRGTDLRLPNDYRALVTLGKGITKDRLTQACMRMRKLGHGQSVVFGIPREIERDIMARKGHVGNIRPSDVLQWSIAETWDELQSNMKIWAHQGNEYHRRKKIWSSCENGDVTKFTSEHSRLYLEPESQTLEQRYCPHPKPAKNDITVPPTTEEQALIAQRLCSFECGDDVKDNPAEQQERELDPEMQQEDQIERPQPAKAAGHELHRDLRTFVTNGCISSTSLAIMPAFRALHDTSAAQHIDLAEFPTDLFVSRDFVRTIQCSGPDYVSDDYQRQVNWILTSRRKGSAESTSSVSQIIIVSPFEAQELILCVKASTEVTLHIYAPRQRLDYRSLDKLELATVPWRKPGPVLNDRQRTLLNIFAGQLFLDNYDDYVTLCKILGLALDGSESKTKVAADGFILGCAHGPAKPQCTFTKSPITFLRSFWTRVRRRGEKIERTHMGRILDGQILQPSEF